MKLKTVCIPLKLLWLLHLLKYVNRKRDTTLRLFSILLLISIFSSCFSLSLDSHQQKSLMYSAGYLSLYAVANLYDHKQPITIYSDSLSPNQIPYLDRKLRADYVKSLSSVSDCLAGVTIAVPVVANIMENHDLFKYNIDFLETISFQLALCEWTKTLVNRKRPYLYDANAPRTIKTKNDASHSFYSMHTTLAFTAATFYYNEHRNENDAIKHFFIGYTPAIVTGILRVQSGNHFLSDVLVGACIGTVGTLLYPIHQDDNYSINLSPSSLALSYRY